MPFQKKLELFFLTPMRVPRDDADSYSEMKQYAAAQGYKWYYAVDANNVLADEFGANRTPECFLFNADGKHVYHGAIDDNPGDASSVNRKHLKVAMDEMIVRKRCVSKRIPLNGLPDQKKRIGFIKLIFVSPEPDRGIFFIFCMDYFGN